MIFEDTLVVNAAAERVWECLLDVNQVASCVPGLKEVRQVDERTFDAVIEATVGPISGKFSFTAHIVESDPPREMAANIDGIDSVTKSKLTGQTTVKLNALSADQTEISYRSTVNVHGRLAILGELVLRATAALILQEVTERFRKQVEATRSPS